MNQKFSTLNPFFLHNLVAGFNNIEKYGSSSDSSVGIMKFPTEWTVKKIHVPNHQPAISHAKWKKLPTFQQHCRLVWATHPPLTWAVKSAINSSVSFEICSRSRLRFRQNPAAIRGMSGTGTGQQ